MKARPATPSDIPGILPLVHQYWLFEGIDGFDAEVVGAQFRRVLSDSQLGACWVALDDGKIAGYLLAVYVFSLEHLGLTAEIDEFFVLPAQRGIGAGAALLAAAETECRRVGCTNVSLQLSRNNNSARQFYHRHGYSERSAYELLDKTLS